jgi:hypothetical protein
VGPGARAQRPLPLLREAAGAATAGESLVVVLDADRLLGTVSDELAALSKRELLARAREAGVKGRSAMTREQLIEALTREA